MSNIFKFMENIGKAVKDTAMVLKDEFGRAAKALDTYYNPFPPKKDKGALSQKANQAATPQTKSEPAPLPENWVDDPHDPVDPEFF